MNKEPQLDHAAKGGPPGVAGDASDVSQSAVPLDSDVCCPRCDYALRGAAALRCPECGLAFTLDELQRIADLPWLFDQAPRRKLLGAWWRTARRAMRPKRFWGQVPLALRPNVWRLLAYWLSFALVCWGLIIIAFPVAAVALSIMTDIRVGRISTSDWFAEFLYRAWFWIGIYFRPLSLFLQLKLVIAVAFVVPAATLSSLLLCSKSLSTAKITFAHQVRIVAYATTFLWTAALSQMFSIFCQFTAYRIEWLKATPDWNNFTYMMVDASFDLFFFAFAWIWFIKHIRDGLKYYGRFENAMSLALISQVIAALSASVFLTYLILLKT